jgi:hypothetical protein
MCLHILCLSCSNINGRTTCWIILTITWTNRSNTTNQPVDRPPMRPQPIGPAWPRISSGSPPTPRDPVVDLVCSPPIVAAPIWPASCCRRSDPAYLSSPLLRSGPPLIVAARIQPASHHCRSNPACLSSPLLRSDMPPIVIRPIWRASHHRHSITSFASLPCSHFHCSITLFAPQ